MGVLGDIVKSFFTVALSDGAADDYYRQGLEQASKHYMAAIEYHSESEFKKAFQILESLNGEKAIDRAAVYDRYKLLIQSHLKLAEFALQSLEADVYKSANNAQTSDEEKPVKVLQSELESVEQHLDAGVLKRDFLIRQPYSVKNDAEVKTVKEKVSHLSGRKTALQAAILMAQSRGAEQSVMKSSYQQKVSTSLRLAVEVMVEFNTVAELPLRAQEARIIFLKEAKGAVDTLNATLQKVIK